MGKARYQLPFQKGTTPMRSKVSLSLAVGIFILFGQACVDPIDTGNDIGLHVAQLGAPLSAPASGPITVTLSVATSGCRQFDRIAASQTPSALILSARGTDISDRDPACSDVLLNENHSYEAQGPFTNPLTITVYRPSAGPIVHTVAIQDN